MLMNATSPLDLTKASFGYAGKRVVDAITVSIESGDVVALLGPNGSGKSTLVKGILGLADLQGGTLTRNATIGYVPQRHSLSNAVRATVTEIVATGRLTRRPWWKSATAADDQAVAEAIAAVGLADRARDEVSALSGGQQRRVLIARALASDPQVLVMDEPTAGVDDANQAILAGVLADLAAQGRTLLIVTHEMDALAEVVTRIVCLDRGHLDFDGSPSAYAAHLTEHPAGSGHHHDSDDITGPIPVIGRAPLDAHGRHRHG